MNKSEGVTWCMIVDGLQVDTFTTNTGKRIRPYDQAPVIIADDELENITKTRIAYKKQTSIKFIQCGELTNKQKTEICLNIAKNTSAKIVSLHSCNLDLLENWSDYIQQLRTENDTRALAELVSDKPKIKENDRTNEKSRAFQKWLGLDIVLQRGSREIYAYNGNVWNKLEHDDLEESVVKFFDENEIGYSDSTIDRLINTLKKQLFIGVANMNIDKMRTHLYPAYLAYTRAMNISEFRLNGWKCLPNVLMYGAMVKHRG